ncbi:MAG TPA: GNAT family N-acetyltransferase [Steroidobacteraceae bacterium]
MNRATIRAADRTDIEVLQVLMTAYWRHEGLPEPDADRLATQLQQFLSTPAYGQGWLALLNDHAVGYLLCTSVYSFEHGGPMAEVDELFVDADHRGQGIGRALLQRVQAYLAERGFVAVQMQVSEHNTLAQSFWAAQGFLPKAGYRLWLAPLDAPPRV